MAGWDTAEGELGVECLRLVDLLVRLGAVGRGAPGLPAGPMSGVEEDLDLDLERLAIPRLLDPALADDVLRRAGHLDPRTWSAWVRPLVLGELHRMSAEGGPPAGSRVPPVTLQALSVGAGSPPDDASAALDWLRTADALEEEAVLQAHAAAQQPGGSSPWSMTVLTLALRRWTLTRGAPEAEIAVVASSASPSVDDLATFAASFRGFPSALALPALKQEPSSDALARLCAELRPLAWERGVFAADARTDDGVDLLVRLRRADHDSRWWVARRGELAHAAPVVYALSVRASREVLPEVLLADDLVAQAQAAWVIAAASAGQYPDEVPRYDPSLLERVLVGRTAATVDGILQQGLPVPLAGAVFVLTVYGSPYADDARHFWKLRSVRSQIGGEVAPVLEHMLRRALASTTADLQLVTDEVSTMVRGYLATTRGRVPDAAELRGHVEATLAPLAPRPGSRGTGLGRLRRG